MKKQSHVGFVPLLLVAGATFVSFFWNLGSYGIFDLDEGLYVEAAREMNVRGDYIIPRVNGDPFYEKPPLVYWLSAGSQLALGQNEFAARLPAAAAGALLAVIILFVAGRFLGGSVGLLAGIAYALNPIVFGAGRQLTMDSVLSLWIAGALFAFFKGYTADDKAGRWFYGFWACSAFAVLSKGAPGIVIPLAVAVIFLVIADGIGPGLRRLFTGTRMLFGIPLFMALIIPWHVAAWQAGGQPFIDEYIVRQHLGRFRGGDTAHRAPFWFYVPGFLLGFFPWSLFSIPVLFERGAGKESKTRNPADLLRLLCKIWLGVVFILFSASGSKLISYILPLYAPAAILAADWAVRAAARKERGSFSWAIGLGALVSCSLFVAVLLHEQIIAQIESATRRPVPMDQVTPAMITFVTALAGAAAFTCLTAWIAAVLGRPKQSLGVVSGGMAVFIGVAVLLGFPAVDRAYLSSLHAMMAFAAKSADSTNEIVLNTPSRRPSALYYLPDRLIPRAGSGRKSVVEVTGTKPSLRPGSSKLPETPFLVIAPLSEKGRLLKSFAGETIGENRGWVAIQVGD